MLNCSVEYLLTYNARLLIFSNLDINGTFENNKKYNTNETLMQTAKTKQTCQTKKRNIVLKVKTLHSRQCAIG